MSEVDDALAELAIFPLPDVVLFPGAALPLHVFEPRYVEMTRAVVAGSRMMGIVRLEPGYQADYLGRPPIHPLATVGEVVSCEEIAGGRLAIVVRGEERIVIERELPPLRAYRQVAARPLPDLEVDETAVAVQKAQLLVVCDQLASRIGAVGAQLRDLVRQADGTAALTFALASALVGDPDQRQALLEMRAPAARLDHLVDHLSDLLVQLGPSSGSAN